MSNVMPTLRQYCVRVVQTKTERFGIEVNEGCVVDDILLECLAVGGIVTNHDVDPKGLTVRCFDLECNDFAADSEKWANRVAVKMVECGFNAVVAPSTR